MRRRLIAVLICAVCALVAFVIWRPRRDARWNVVLLTLDTTRADHLGCFGHPGDITPNLDALAYDGVRFEQAISTAGVTPVSHASILTGLDNKEHQVRVLSGQCGFRLPKDVPTLATVLHDAGYATAAIHSAFPVSAYYGFDRGFDDFESFEGAIKKGVAGNMTWDLPHLQRRSDETTDLVLKRLQKTTKPFFLWVHYWDPHDNARVPPAEFITPDIPRAKDGTLLSSPQLYAAEVHYMDHQIGRVIDALVASGEYEHTLFVVVADHGEGLGDHDWLFHRILYQEQIHVPLIVRPPADPAHALPDGGRAVPEIVRTTDIFPTVLDYLGLKAPRAVSGRSLRALIEGRPDTPRTAFADQINGYDLNAQMLTVRPKDDFMYAVIDGGWKLVWRPLHPEASELFHLDVDPHEHANVFASEPAQVLRLEKLLARHNTHDGWVTAPCHKSDDAGIDAAAAADVLKTLGYAGTSGVTTLDPRWSFCCPADVTHVVDDAAELDCPDEVLLISRDH